MVRKNFRKMRAENERDRGGERSVSVNFESLTSELFEIARITSKRARKVGI